MMGSRFPMAVPGNIAQSHAADVLICGRARGHKSERSAVAAPGDGAPGASGDADRSGRPFSARRYTQGSSQHGRQRACGKQQRGYHAQSETFRQSAYNRQEHFVACQLRGTDSCGKAGLRSPRQQRLLVQEPQAGALARREC